MPVTADTQRLEQQLLDQLDLVLDPQARDLVQAWAIAWDELVPDLRDALLDMLVAGETISRGQLQRSQRLRSALALVAAELQRLAGESGVRITGDLAGVIDTAGGAQASIIDSQLPANATQLVDLNAWSRVDARQVAAIVRRSTEKITARSRPLARETLSVVRRELIRGVTVGSNPRATAARILQRAELGFNGGLTRALVISRTETLDAHRAAAALGQEPHSDVLAGWVWLASLRPRTCRACLSMHGRMFPLTEPGPMGHQQCRCARQPKTKSWTELGFDDVEEPPDLTPDADVFFAGLSAAEKRDLLGREGYEAWLAGEFPREEWAKRRQSKGWRDSYVPAKPGEDNAAGDGQQPPKGPPAPSSGEEPSDRLADKIAVQDDAIRVVVDRNVALMDSVHRVNPGMATVEAKAMSAAARRLLPGAHGFYKHDTVIGPELQIRAGGARSDLTVVHESGHMLDDLVFGPGTSDQAMGSESDPGFHQWRRAIEGTDAFRTLVRMLFWEPSTIGWWVTVADPEGRTLGWDPDQRHVAYLLDAAELFARSYAQWIAAKTGDPVLLEQVALELPQVPEGYTLISGGPAGYPVHWTDDDFAPVADALDELFRARGLLIEEAPGGRPADDA